MSVILTKRSVGRIPRWDFARDICEMFHCVQHDKLCIYIIAIKIRNTHARTREATDATATTPHYTPLIAAYYTTHRYP